METTSNQCPLCGNYAPVEESDVGDWRCVSCCNCGDFEFTAEVAPILSRSSNLHLLSGVTRQHWESRKVPLRIMEMNIEDLWRLAPRDRDLPEKAMRLLLGLERKTSHPGASFSCTITDCSLGYSQNMEEFRFLSRYLANRGFIDSFAAHSSGWGGIISMAGWAAIDAYRTPNSESDKVFVAMWFNDVTTDAYSGGIRPAIEDDCGYRAVRIDTKDFLGDIVDEIIAEIRESRFIVADFTGQRHGVYYEAGYARGMGLPVILTCRNDHVDGLHFDTRQQNHIVWETAAELRKRLANRIRAVIGVGPHKRGERERS